MRNAEPFEEMTLHVTLPNGKILTYEGVRSFSSDPKGQLHVHNDNGPVVLFNSSGWLLAEVAVTVVNREDGKLSS